MSKLLAWLMVPLLIIGVLSGPGSAEATVRGESEEAASVDGRSDGGDIDSIPSDQLMAVELYAAEVGVSLSTAWRMLLKQNELSEYAMTVRDLPEFAGFKLETFGEQITGMLALTDTSVVIVPKGVPVSVVEARMPREAIPAFSEQQTVRLEAHGVRDVVAVTYEPFNDEVIVWLDSESDETLGARQSQLETALASTLDPELLDALIRLERVPELSLNYGGRKVNRLVQSWKHCTTAFGVGKVINLELRFGFLTAEHCRKELGPNTWRVLLPSGSAVITGYHNASFGGYRDRVIMEGPGVSPLTNTGQMGIQNMGKVPAHIFLGQWVCHYGWASNWARCGWIAAINVPVVTDHGTVFVSQNMDGIYCQAGDSGGPVWRPGSPAIPTGTIEAGVPFQGCGYLALDDQLAGSGWLLR